MMQKGVVPSRRSLLGENTMAWATRPQGAQLSAWPHHLPAGGPWALGLLAASFLPSVNMLHTLIQRVTYVKTLHKKDNPTCTRDILITVLNNNFTAKMLT